VRLINFEREGVCHYLEHNELRAERPRAKKCSREDRSHR
jgi:hypothetical protein